MNALDGGVFESNRRFHAAVPALNQPALRPTRGSGLGAVVDMFAGDGAPACVGVPVDDAVQPASATSASANGALRDELRECRV
jgi:hypothetical protein